MKFMLTVLVVLGAALMVGCRDKAEPAFRECEAAETKGDFPAAVTACERAVSADKTSVFGKKAGEKIAELQARVAKAKAEAEATERARLLASANPADWEALTQRYPLTSEAKVAAEKLAKNESLCANIEHWTELVTGETFKLSTVLNEYKKKNLLAKGPVELIQASGDMRKHSAKHQQAVEKAKADLEKQGTKPNEAELRKRLAGALDYIAIYWKKYAQAFAQGTAGIEQVTAIDDLIDESLAPDNRQLVADLNKACGK